MSKGFSMVKSQKDLIFLQATHSEKMSDDVCWQLWKTRDITFANSNSNSKDSKHFLVKFVIIREFCVG